MLITLVSTELRTNRWQQPRPSALDEHLHWIETNPMLFRNQPHFSAATGRQVALPVRLKKIESHKGKNVEITSQKPVRLLGGNRQVPRGSRLSRG